MHLNIVSVVSHFRHYEYSVYGCNRPHHSHFPFSGIRNLQHLMRGCLPIITAYAFDPNPYRLYRSVIHLRPNAFLLSIAYVYHWSLSFLPSVSHTGESFTYHDPRIGSFAFVSNSCGGDSPIKKFTHDSLALLLGLWATSQTFSTICLCHRPRLSSPQYLNGGESSIRDFALLPLNISCGENHISETLPFFPSVSHAGESHLSKGLRI